MITGVAPKVATNNEQSQRYAFLVPGKLIVTEAADVVSVAPAVAAGQTVKEASRMPSVSFQASHS